MKSQNIIILKKYFIDEYTEVVEFAYSKTFLFFEWWKRATVTRTVISVHSAKTYLFEFPWSIFDPVWKEVPLKDFEAAYSKYKDKFND